MRIPVLLIAILLPFGVTQATDKGATTTDKSPKIKIVKPERATAKGLNSKAKTSICEEDCGKNPKTGRDEIVKPETTKAKGPNTKAKTTEKAQTERTQTQK